MTWQAILAALSPSLIAGFLVLWLCVRVRLHPTTRLDERNDHLRFQQPRRLRVGQSNHKDASA